MAQTVEVEPRVIDVERVPLAHRTQHRPKDRLIDVVDPLTRRADEVVVVLGRARDVGGDVSRPLEASGHAGLDLRLERAVDGREPEPRVARAQALVQLLRRDRLFLAAERLGHDDALGR